jgi:hypothetical protein
LRLGKKISKTLSQKISWMWWHTPVIPVTQEVEVYGRPGQKYETLSEKQTKVKKAGAMDQMVDSLPSKWEALSSNPKINNNNKKGSLRQ